jgi:hypothetical protein
MIALTTMTPQEMACKSALSFAGALLPPVTVIAYWIYILQEWGF